MASGQGTTARAARSRCVATLVAATLATACSGGRQSSAPLPETDLPAVEGTAPTVKTLAGIWFNLDQSPLMARFGSDGTFAFDNHLDLDTAPAIVGAFELDGRSVIATVRSGPACRAGDNWTWRSGISDDGRLETVLMESGTGNCAQPIGTKWTFVRLSPRSVAGAKIRAHPAPEADPLPKDEEAAWRAVQGLWLLERGGHLLRLTSFGTYTIDNMGLLGTDPYDQGTLKLNGGRLTFTSDGVSRRCTPGSRWVWEKVQVGRVGRWLRAVVAADGCSHDAGTAVTWIGLPP